MSELSFQLSESDLRNAARLNAKAPVKVRMTTAAFLMVMIFVVGAVIRRASGADLIVWAIIAFCMSTFVFVASGRGWTFKDGWIKQMIQRQHDILLPTTVRWDQVGLAFINTKGEYRHNWSDFLKWKADDSSLLVYMSEHGFRIVAFPDQFAAMLDEVVHYLKDSGVKGLDLRERRAEKI